MQVKSMIHLGRAVSSAVLTLLALTLTVIPIGCSGSTTAGTAVSLLLAERNVEEGQSFTVEVQIETDTPCRGAEFVLSFDPTLMKCESVSEGNFFADWAVARGGSTLMVPQSPAIDNSQGLVATLGIAIMGGGTGGPTGSGTLCTYNFTGLTSGMASPTLSGVVVVDETGQSITDVSVRN